MSIKDQIDIKEPRWYAVKCKYRCERRLVEELNDLGIESYTPIRKRIKQYASRKKQLTSALIPSHIFVKITRELYVPLLKHQNVFGFLNFSGVLIPIPEEEMTIMRRVVGEEINVELTDQQFAIGDQVEVIGGELTGLKGVLVAEGNHNLIIQLESIGVGLKLNIEAKYLRLIKKAA